MTVTGRWRGSLRPDRRISLAGRTLPSHHASVPAHCRRAPLAEEGGTSPIPSGWEMLTPPAAKRETNHEVRDAKQDIPEWRAAGNPADQTNGDEKGARDHEPKPDAAHFAAPDGAAMEMPFSASTWRA